MVVSIPFRTTLVHSVYWCSLALWSLHKNSSRIVGSIQFRSTFVHFVHLGTSSRPRLSFVPPHKKTSRMAVSTLFRTTFVHIWPKLSFLAPAQEPLQNGRINTASCDVPFISYTEGHDLAPGLVLNPSHKKQFHNGRFVWLASISRNQSHYLAPGLVLYPLHKTPSE